MKKFTSNDLFYNTLLASPKYTIIMQSGSLRINDQINQNYEKSSSINGVEYPGVYSFSKLTYTGSYQYTASISTTLIYSSSVQGWDYRYSKYSSVKKVAALKNIFSYYASENQYSKIDYYLKNNGVPNYTTPVGTAKSTLDSNLSAVSFRTNYMIAPTSSINLIEIPRDFYGDYIKPGSVQLNMYVSGVLTASAMDSDNTGKLIQTYGSGSGNIIGSVFYDHGILLLTGAYALNTQQAPYIQPLSSYTSSVNPVNDYLKWIYFGTYQNITGSGIETKYELIFQGTNFIPTITMFCNAEKNEMFWSNNRTFIEAGQGDSLFIGEATSSTDKTGSVYYADSGSVLVPSDNTFRETLTTTIKNTISSSFANYSASYEPQVFISQIGIYDEQKNLIGIAKLANPVRKTKDLDYTFKLKLDF